MQDKLLRYLKPEMLTYEVCVAKFKSDAQKVNHQL